MDTKKGGKQKGKTKVTESSEDEEELEGGEDGSKEVEEKKSKSPTSKGVEEKPATVMSREDIKAVYADLQREHPSTTTPLGLVQLYSETLAEKKKQEQSIEGR